MKNANQIADYWIEAWRMTADAHMPVEDWRSLDDAAAKAVTEGMEQVAKVCDERHNEVSSALHAILDLWEDDASRNSSAFVDAIDHAYEVLRKWERP